MAAGAGCSDEGSSRSAGEQGEEDEESRGKSRSLRFIAGLAVGVELSSWAWLAMLINQVPPRHCGLHANGTTAPRFSIRGLALARISSTGQGWPERPVRRRIDRCCRT